MNDWDPRPARDARPPTPSSSAIAILGGLVAAGIGLATWAIAGGVDKGVRDLCAIAGTFVGGIVAGTIVGQHPRLALAWTAAAMPLALIALLGPKHSDWDGLFRMLTLLLAAGTATVVVLGSAAGAWLGHRFAVGPIRPVPGVMALVLAALVAATGWLWFVANVERR